MLLDYDMIMCYVSQLSNTGSVGGYLKLLEYCLATERYLTLAEMVYNAGLQKDPTSRHCSSPTYWS